MFELTKEQRASTIVLRYAGDMCLQDVPRLTKLLEEAVSTPKIRQVALDLSHVHNVDVSGLGVLVSTSTRARARGCRLSLLTPPPHVYQLLCKAEIEGFFPTYECEGELKGWLTDEPTT